MRKIRRRKEGIRGKEELGAWGSGLRELRELVVMVSLACPEFAEGNHGPLKVIPVKILFIFL